MEDISAFYKDKTILITGGAGSIGSNIARKLLQFDLKRLRILDNNETALFDLEQELQTKNVRMFIGDIRDKERLERAIEGVDIVFHAAALKHVPLCEYNPFEAVKTNVVGTQNLIDVAIDEDIEKFITISTDKAVAPINVMGATKLLSERLTISSNFYRGRARTAFSCIRFGNVLDTRGSVIPLFRKQIQNNGPITVTDPNMTRFMISVPKAVNLVLKSAEIAQGGEIFILKMPALRIGDLAEIMRDDMTGEYIHKPKKISITKIGRRVGEKLYEELMTEEETENAFETDDMFIVLPDTNRITTKRWYEKSKKYKKTSKDRYTSNNVRLLNKNQVNELLDELKK